MILCDIYYANMAFFCQVATSGIEKTAAPQMAWG